MSSPQSGDTSPHGNEKGNAAHRFTAEINKLPKVSDHAKAIHQFVSHHIQDEEVNASLILEQLDKRKRSILRKTKGWMGPLVKETLDNLVTEVQQFTAKGVEEKGEGSDLSSPTESPGLDAWLILSQKCRDHKGLMAQILEKVATKTKGLINRDIQIVREYQMQSLSHLPEESEEFKNLEVRLAGAIREPISRLLHLQDEMNLIKPRLYSIRAAKELDKFIAHHWTKKEIKEYLHLTRPGLLSQLKRQFLKFFGWVRHPASYQEMTRWGNKLQKQRENYFDQVLQKIDHIMKDVSYKSVDQQEAAVYEEIDGELAFIERELGEIDAHIAEAHLMSEADKQFLLGRLEGILDHLHELERSEYTPQRMKTEILRSRVTIAMDLLE